MYTPYYCRNGILLLLLFRHRSFPGYLFSDADDGFLDSLMRTIAFKLCIHCICKFHIQAISTCSSICSGVCPLSSILVTEEIFLIFSSSLSSTSSDINGHYLHNKSTCTVYSVVLVHQYSKAHRRRNLFAGCKNNTSDLLQSHLSAE